MIDETKIPKPPEGVSVAAIWFEVGKSNAKLDVLLDQLPDLHKRVRGLERRQTQIFTGLAILGAGFSVAVSYAKSLIEYLST